MQIITNERLIQRNRKIAQIASLSGLLVLIGGMVISFTREDMINLAFVALLLGFVLSQIGMFFTNRWGRNPRPDELLNQALKGLDNKYAIYHFTTPASHLIVGPAGIWVLQPKHQRGEVTYSKNRWRLRGGGAWQTYLKIFGQEGIGRPDLDMAAEIERVRKFLSTKLEGIDDIPISATLVFTHEGTDIQITEDDGAPAPTLPLNKLKDFMRKATKTKPISQTLVQQIQGVLPQVE